MDRKLDLNRMIVVQSAMAVNILVSEINVNGCVYERETVNFE